MPPDVWNPATLKVVSGALVTILTLVFGFLRFVRGGALAAMQAERALLDRDERERFAEMRADRDRERGLRIAEEEAHARTKADRDQGWNRFRYAYERWRACTHELRNAHQQNDGLYVWLSSSADIWAQARTPAAEIADSIRRLIAQRQPLPPPPDPPPVDQVDEVTPEEFHYPPRKDQS